MMESLNQRTRERRAIRGRARDFKPTPEDKVREQFYAACQRAYLEARGGPRGAAARLRLKAHPVLQDEAPGIAAHADHRPDESRGQA